MKFKGWVPTITGRLSFDLFGDSDYPSDAISQNCSDASTRYAIIYQKRDLSDATLPFKNVMTKLLYGLQGRFWFLCLAMCNEELAESVSKPGEWNEQPFEGKLLIFHEKATWRNEVEPAVRNAQKNLVQHSRDGRLGQQGLKKYFGEEYDKLTALAASYASFIADFSLERNGIIELRVDDTVLSDKKPKFPEIEKQKRYIQHIVCSQLFFFLRDIGHKHQHHPPTTDTIVDLYEAHDDLAWRRDTLRSLCRKAIEFKRSKRTELYSSSLGILAYIKSFQRINKNLGKGSDILPGFNAAALEKGVVAAVEEFSHKHQELRQKWDAAKTLVLAIIALFVSFVGLYQLSNIAPINLSKEAYIFLAPPIGNILNHPLRTISIFPLIFFIFAASTHIIDIYGWSVTRGAAKIVFSFGKKYAISILSVLLICIFILMIKLAIELGFFIFSK